MIEFLLDKKIAILGLGINNRHLADYFTAKNIPYDVLDKWTEPDDLMGQLDKYNIVFRTPGIPYQSQLIQDALSKGVNVYSQTKLFFDLCPCPIIGVTGTKGKGTTSSLIYSILKQAGKNTWLAGNIGKDPFEFLDQIKPSDFVVLELSSFQLQDLHRSPHVAVVLNITTDHVNPLLKMATHYTHQEYVEAKSTIVKHQKPDDFAVLHPDLPEWFKNLGEGKKSEIKPNAVSHMKTKLLGRHNFENISAAVETARILKIDESVIEQAVAEFEPLPHRLQYILGTDGITYVNDSFSTNEDSTVAAIKALPQPLVLILGGSDKGHDYKLLAKEIVTALNVKGVVVIGEVADRIRKALGNYSGPILDGGNTMPEIVNAARSLAKSGDAILLSPAAASFGLFNDYKERGYLFMKEVPQS